MTVDGVGPGRGPDLRTGGTASTGSTASTASTGSADDDAGALPTGRGDGPPPVLVASWGRRVLAVLLDHALLAALTFLVMPVQPVEPPAYVPFGPRGAGPAAPTWTDSGWVVAAVVAVLALQAFVGSTPGKLVVGIAVVREADARPAGPARTALRLVAHALDAILCIGYLRPLWNRRGQTFADSLARTVVLTTRRPLGYRLRPDPSVAAGPPGGWVAADEPVWRARATVVAGAACAFGVLLAAGSTTTSSRVTEETCSVAVVTGAGATELARGSVLRDRPSGTVTRLGIERPLRVEPAGVEVVWDWPDGPRDGDVLRVVLSRADGTGSRTVDHVVAGGAVQSGGTVQHAGGGEPLTDGRSGVRLPVDVLAGLGDDWTWSLAVLRDGVASPPCLPPR